MSHICYTRPTDESISQSVTYQVCMSIKALNDRNGANKEASLSKLKENLSQ